VFERFTKRARQSLAEAQLEAANLGHNFIGTEHLLLGLMRVHEGVASQVLTAAGVEIDRVREKVAEIIGGGVDAGALASIGIDVDAVREAVEASFGPGAFDRAVSGVDRRGAPFTPRSKKVMELALREALGLGHNYIGTEHLLLGIIRECHGVAAVVLHRLLPETDFRGLVLDRLRHAS
jgi:ATP-dependent Clp protease ATP-binding subunit ClpA